MGVEEADERGLHRPTTRLARRTGGTGLGLNRLKRGINERIVAKLGPARAARLNVQRSVELGIV